MKAASLAIRASWTATALGCESRAITRASRLNRARARGSKAIPETISFRALGDVQLQVPDQPDGPHPPLAELLLDEVAAEQDLAGLGLPSKVHRVEIDRPEDVARCVRPGSLGPEPRDDLGKIARAEDADRFCAARTSWIRGPRDGLGEE